MSDRNLRKQPVVNYCDDDDKGAREDRNHVNKGNKRLKTKDAAAVKCTSRCASNTADTVSDLASTNCKLSNKVIDLNKVLLEKNDSLLNMQSLYHGKVVQNIELRTIAGEKSSKINQLQRELKDMKDGQYCEDLINLDDEEEKNF